MWKDFAGRRETFALEEKWGKDHYTGERESGEGGRRKGCKARDINRLCSGRRGKGEGEGAATAAGDRARHTYTGKGMYDLAMVPHLPYMDSLFPGEKGAKVPVFPPIRRKKEREMAFLATCPWWEEHSSMHVGYCRSQESCTFFPVLRKNAETKKKVSS